MMIVEDLDGRQWLVISVLWLIVVFFMSFQKVFSPLLKLFYISIAFVMIVMIVWFKSR